MYFSWRSEENDLGSESFTLGESWLILAPCFSPWALPGQHGEETMTTGIGVHLYANPGSTLIISVTLQVLGINVGI